MKLFSFFIALILLFSSCKNNQDNDKTDTLQDEPKEIEMYNGVPISEKEPDNYTGEYLELYKNDLPKIRGHKVNGVREGKWEGWHFTGAKASEGFYVNGKEDGVYTVYFDNGKVRYKGKYKMGVKVGSWRFYTEEGELYLDTIYKP